MDDAIQTAKALAIVRQMRSPGFREVIALLEALAEQARSEAFECSDDSRAVRLLHEGRGATTVVAKFKSEIARLEAETLEMYA